MQGDSRSLAWEITPARKERAWEYLQDANGRLINEEEKAMCDSQQKLRLLGIDEWSKEGLESVDYRESMTLSNEVHSFNCSQ